MAARRKTLDRLHQVVLEIEALRKTIGVIPAETLWERPLDQPSTGEHLWLIHLCDRHCFIPTIEMLIEDGSAEFNAPVYTYLLSSFPCPDDLDQVLSEITASRERLVTAVQSIDSTVWKVPVVRTEEGVATPKDLARFVASHDIHLLSLVGQRLLEMRDSKF